MSKKQERLLEAFLKLKEGNLSEFKKKFRSILGPDEVTPEIREQVRVELEADYERLKRETGWCKIEKDDEDLLPGEAEELREAAAGLQDHSKQVLKEFGLWRKGPKGIRESRQIRESDVSTPARITSASFGKTTITEENTDHVGSERDGLVMVGPGIWLPKELAENGNDEEIWEYMMENRIGM